jgi:ribulose-phosphate 3-epimerase
MALIAPALLAADFARLGEALRIVEAAGARRIHIDVADGHFAHELTVGQPVFESIRKATRLELDLHLLIERPERYVSDFAGARRIAVHPESTPQIHRVLDVVRRQGIQPGVSLMPGTPLDSVADVLDEVDFVSVLAADPVFGPDFEPSFEDVPDLAAGARDPSPRRASLGPSLLGLRKVRQAARMREDRGLRFEIQVEGGLRVEHLQEWAAAGADILVGGFAIFDTDDPAARLKDLIRRAEACSSGEASRNLKTGSNP